MRRTLIIFVKEPVAGRVKTRLGRDIGMVPAAWWYRHNCARLIRSVAGDRRWQTVLAVAPDTALAAPAWPLGIPRMAQGAGNLGARMRRLLQDVAPGPAVLIGSDIPGIRPAHIARAFATLGDCEAVLGPAPDGGYWLIGVRHGGVPMPASALQNVRWSGPHALGDTVDSLRPWSVALTQQMRDVDTAADL